MLFAWREPSPVYVPSSSWLLQCIPGFSRGHVAHRRPSGFLMASCTTSCFLPVRCWLFGTTSTIAIIVTRLDERWVFKQYWIIPTAECCVACLEIHTISTSHLLLIADSVTWWYHQERDFDIQRFSVLHDALGIEVFVTVICSYRPNGMKSERKNL